MSFPAHVFREYDVRGVADRDLSDGFAFALGRAFAEILARGAGGVPEGQGGHRPRPAARAPRRVAVGRDGRLSSPRLFENLTRGLQEGGAHVIDVGIGPTPLLYFAAHHEGTDGAVQITGSHNPGEDNGFKMMRGKASFYGADIQDLRAVMAAPAAPAEPGTMTSKDISDAYV